MPRNQGGFMPSIFKGLQGFLCLMAVLFGEPLAAAGADPPPLEA